MSSVTSQQYHNQLAVQHDINADYSDINMNSKLSVNPQYHQKTPEEKVKLSNLRSSVFKSIRNAGWDRKKIMNGPGRLE